MNRTGASPSTTERAGLALGPRARRCVEAAAVSGVLAVAAVISIGWNLLAAVLVHVLPRRLASRLGRAGIAYGYRAIWAAATWSGQFLFDLSQLESLREEGRVIVAANHPCLLDALLLVSRLPRSVCIMKAGLTDNWLLGPGARLAHYIRNDSTHGMIRGAVDELRDGGQLVIFPEGTRTECAPINSFRPGITLIAKLADAPIQTVFIDIDSPYTCKGWPVWRVPTSPVVVRVRLGQRFAPADDHKRALDELSDYFAAHVHVPRHLERR
ncbi:lysophospholipid acyltransferase family protein [soil metagenome]